ncbi:MAG: peptidoglycan DD-metalloendopeptidase family protein [Alphaproteobacteria bacterium]|nr:peptidoglycan DD-metalloendopeptidase family protein [Alphaproteobacteria bacterium]
MIKTYVNTATGFVAAQLTKIADRETVVRAIDWLGQHVPVRHRYVLTRDNRLRLRYVLPGATCALVMAMTTVVSFSGSSRALQAQDFSFIKDVASIEPAAGMMGGEFDLVDRLQTTHRRLQRYLDPREDGAQSAEESDDADSGVTLASFQPRALPQPKETMLEIGKGDTLAAVLHRAGVGATEAHAALEVLKKELDPRSIRPGQNVYVRLDPVSPENSEDYRMTQMGVSVDAFKSVALKRNGDDFEAGVLEKPTERRVYAKNAPIEVSLYGSAAKAGIPNAAIAEVIRVLSWDIDFQRDIRRGDVLDVMYDQTETDDGKGVKFGNVIYARLNINGQEIPVYRYEMKDGTVDYFTADGNSVRKALMKTPIDGARVSSGFGVRKHPVLGYTKMHKGMDFAAPTGTPIYAAGDGTIEKLGRWSSYGNYVRIRHNSNIKTAYAHMSKFGKGLAAGSRVKQGQVIGYVGATGRVTGAHLHYEVLLNGAHINPNSVKLPTGETLKGSELASFKLKMQETNRQFTDLITRGESLKVASAAGTIR